MKAIFYLALSLLLGVPSLLFSQVIISGQVTDQETGQPVGGSVISVLPVNSKQVLAFTQSNPQGNFTLSYQKEPRVIILKIRHLSYKEYEQTILLAEAGKDTIRIKAVLIPRSVVLDEIEIKAPSPIIVKKDTIIYDITHWQQAGDETLEDVLRKMPGFKVRADGELEFEDRQIDKVLINGKEFNSTGAAVLTRSLDPSRIENVEIRKKEQSKKLKNSLLDSKEIMVLDIKLKDELDNSLFGRLRATAGLQSQRLLPGAYVNFFSIKEKSATHFFAERDLLGNQEISIYEIRNIGDEAMGKLFQLPADFAELMQREGYNQTLYGFKDYSRNERNIVGLTSKYSFSPQADFYIGSYNTFSRLGIDRSSEWRFLQSGAGASFVQQQLSEDLESLNKLEWRYDTERLKTRIDMNLTYTDKNRRTANDETLQALFYQFRQETARFSVIPNALIEYELSPSLGLQFKTSYARVSSRFDHRLSHNDTSYIRFLQDDTGSLVNNFGQDSRQISHMLLSEAKAQYQSRIGTWSAGLQAQYQQLGSEKNAFSFSENGRSLLPASIFSGRQLTLSYTKWQPYASHEASFGRLRFEQQWGLGLMSFPDSSAQMSRMAMPEFMFSGMWNGFININMRFQQSLSVFPLAALMFGHDLRDFRQITLTRQMAFEPRPERVANISFYKLIPEKGWTFSLAGAHGRTFKGEQFLLGAAPFIAGFYNQLPGGFYLSEFQVDKQFKKSPLTVNTVHSLMQNYMENIEQVTNQPYRVLTSRRQHGLKLEYRSPQKRFGYEWENKISRFGFSSDLGNLLTVQHMFSSALELYSEWFSEKLIVEPAVRYVHFSGAQQANFTNLACTVRYRLGKIRIFAEGDNLLNNRTFIRQDQQPLLLSTDAQVVFARYVRMGLTWTVD
ncbi:hypothetical protein [Rhodoflexus sp.]